MLRRLASDWFLIGMITAVALATLWPHLGASDGPLHADTLADASIFLVFLLHGLGLSTANLKAGMLRWKLHLVVQASTFVLFPLLGAVLMLTAGRLLPQGLLLGFVYLCALPSTISSSVAMTALAKGNVPAAVFNATLSSLLGIVLTPVLVSLLAGASGGALPLGPAIANIAKLLLLPFVLGQVLRPVLGADRVARVKKITNGLDRFVILLLVWVSFCNSVQGGLWRDHGPGTLLVTLLGAALLLGIVLTLTTRTARALHFDHGDEAAAVFCGSKKTLASGVPMAKLLFGASPEIGLIVLPIMLYHQLQLFVCSSLAERYARRAD